MSFLEFWKSINDTIAELMGLNYYDELTQDIESQNEVI
jgi:hypothetical protein